MSLTGPDGLLKQFTKSMPESGAPAQLTAVDAGGAHRLLEAEVGAVHQPHRFRIADEASATAALRNGDPDALAFLLEHRASVPVWIRWWCW